MSKVLGVKRSQVTGLTLELEADEIQFLVDVLNRIGGSPDKSRRNISARLRTTLKQAGVDISSSQSGDATGSITFEDIPGKRFTVSDLKEY